RGNSMIELVNRGVKSHRLIESDRIGGAVAQAVVEGDGALGLLAFGGGDLRAELTRLDRELRAAMGALREPPAAAHRENRDEKKREPAPHGLAGDVGALAAAGTDGIDRRGFAIVGDDRPRAEQQDEAATAAGAARVGHARQRSGWYAVRKQNSLSLHLRGKGAVMRTRRLTALVLTASMGLTPLAGCENLPGNKKEQGAVIGGVGGAVAGAAIGKHNRALGALIGGARGAGGG